MTRSPLPAPERSDPPGLMVEDRAARRWKVPDIFYPYAILTVFVSAIIGLFVLTRASGAVAENNLRVRLDKSAAILEGDLSAIESTHQEVLYALQEAGASGIETVEQALTPSSPVDVVLIYHPASGTLTAIPHPNQQSLISTHPSNADLRIIQEVSHQLPGPARITPAIEVVGSTPYLFSALPVGWSEDELAWETILIAATEIKPHLMEDPGIESGAIIALYTGDGDLLADMNGGLLGAGISIDRDTYARTAAGLGPWITDPLETVLIDNREYGTAYVPVTLFDTSVGVIRLLLPTHGFVPGRLARSDEILFISFGLAVMLFVLGGVMITMTRVQPMVNALNVELAQSSTILSSIADGVVVRNHSGEIVLTNKAARDLLTVNGVYSGETLGRIPLAVEDADVSWIEVGDRTISVSGAPVVIDDRRGVGDILVLRDVTQQALVERTKNNFLNQVGHELRTPLTAIQSYADILRVGGELMSTEAQARAVSQIIEQSSTLSLMIDRVIEVAALQSGGYTLLQEQVDLPEMVRRVLGEWQDDLEAHNLAPRLDLPFTADGPLIVYADRERIHYVLDAYLANARQFSPDGGILTVTLAHTEATVTVSVIDPGVGISADDLPHVFDRFFRGTPYDKTGHVIDVRGIGQGLYLARAIIEAHRGTVRAESKPGQGSTFSFTLPLYRPEMPPASAANE